jgi:hypothetical protein
MENTTATVHGDLVGKSPNQLVDTNDEDYHELATIGLRFGNYQSRQIYRWMSHLIFRIPVGESLLRRRSGANDDLCNRGIIEQNKKQEPLIHYFL